MTIVIDQSNAGTAVNDVTNTSIAVNTSANIASSGFIVIIVGWWSATVTLSSVTISGLSPQIAAQGKHPSDNWSVAIGYAQAPAGLASTSTVTANFSATTAGRQIGVYSFTGVATSSPVDVTGTANTTGAAGWTTGSLALAAGSVLIGASHCDGGSAAASAITSPSIEAIDWGDGSNTSVTSGYRIEAVAASYTVAGTWTPSLPNVGLGAAFLEGVAAPPAPVPTLRTVRSNLRLA